MLKNKRIKTNTSSRKSKEKSKKRKKREAKRRKEKLSCSIYYSIYKWLSILYLFVDIDAEIEGKGGEITKKRKGNNKEKKGK